MFCCFNIMKTIFSDRKDAKGHAGKSNNPYEILNIPRRSSLKEIKLARKRVLQRYHPDKHIGFSAEAIATAVERSKKANWAYLVLKQKHRRRHKATTV